MNMHGVIARLRVILTATVTWLVVLAAVLTAAAGPLAESLGIDHPVVTLIGQAVAVIVVAITIITRVTPVLPAARGLLPPEGSIPVTPDEARLADQLTSLRARGGATHERLDVTPP